MESHNLIERDADLIAEAWLVAIISSKIEKVCERQG